jgi:predicted 3-demethylubiquinone-9 3-methyltransferase (glyoxalase superfamily)
MPSLLFVGDQAGNAEGAVHFYTGLFDDAEILAVMRYGADQPPDKEGTVTFADFTLANQKFAAMDSANEHNFTFNEAVSLLVECEDQAEVDGFWDELSVVPEAEACGWLKDKYGVSWQIIPKQLGELLNNPDPEKSQRVMKAMLQMKKIDVAGLYAALEPVAG